MTMICPYCGRDAELVAGTEIYPYRPDLHAKSFWRCAPCRAWVGCHGNTQNPLGRLANSELRGWKARAHAAFDPLWQRKMKRDGVSKSAARRAGYGWIGRELGLGADECHIGLFDVETCKRLIDLCRSVAASGQAAADEHPKPGMIRTGHIRGQGFYAYIYTSVDSQRLQRIDKYSKKPRTVTSSWLVDNVPAASFEEAMALLQAAPAETADLFSHSAKTEISTNGAS